MTNSDRQTDEWESQNLREKEEEMKKESYKENYLFICSFHFNNKIFMCRLKYILFIL